MIQTSCSQCNQSGQILSGKGICWDCYTSKEKAHFKYMVNSRTQLLAFTIILCVLFLLNAIPAIRLGHEFTDRYSYINNTYIRIGKDLVFLFFYLLVKLCFTINLWRSRYISVGSKFLNPATELIVLIIKFSLMNSFLNNSLNWEIRLSPLTNLLEQYTEDTLSPTYIAFFLSFGFLFLLIRALSCLLAYLANYFYQKYYKEFYANHPNRKRIYNIAHWEMYYKHHPEYFKKKDTLFVAARVEKTIALNDEIIRNELKSYVKDEKRLERFHSYLTSSDNQITIDPKDLKIYLTYVKDKVSLWKADNLTTDDHLDQEVIGPFSARFNSIKDRYQYCDAETKTFFELTSLYTNEFDSPMKEILAKKREVKSAIEQLYQVSDALYRHDKCNAALTETLAMLDNQVLDLNDYSVHIDNEFFNYDHVLITNRGIFLIDIETFDTSLSYDLYIDRDGSWLRQLSTDADNKKLELLSSSITTQNNYQLLKLEKLINQLMNHTLDNYMELHQIVILGDDDILLTNHSAQTVIRIGELLNVLRSYPAQYSEEQMLHIKSLLESQLIPSSEITIPNYRKLVIDQLDDYLDSKIQIVRNNSELMNRVTIISGNLAQKNKLSFLPLLTFKS